MLSYKLRKTTVALHQEATRSVAISIPAGTVLKVVDSSANSGEFVDVEWNGKRVQVFAIDLRDRGELFRMGGASHDDE